MNHFSQCHRSNCATKEDINFFITATYHFFSLWLHCTVYQQFQVSSKITIVHFSPGKPFPAPKSGRICTFAWEKCVVCWQWHPAHNSSSFNILHVIHFRYCVKYGQEVGIKVIYTSEYLQLCQHQLHVRNTSEWIHSAGERRHDWHCFLEVIHHARAKDRAMNTLFWEHRFWQCPSILIISWLLCQCSL